MLLEKEVTMNLNYRGNPIVLDALQGDSCRALTVHFYAGEKPWTIPADAHVLIQYQFRDGTGGVYDTLTDGTAPCRVQENTAEISLAPQLFAMPGITKLQICFLQEQKQLTSFPVELQVHPQLSPQACEREYVNLAQWMNANKGLFSADHAVFFTIKAGTVSLKQEYAAIGEKSTHLPHHLIIPDKVNGKKVTGIEKSAFEGNRMLESVIIPAGVTVIPERCFKDCSNLYAVYSGDQITEIESYAFARTAIKEAIFPNLTALGEYAFENCFDLVTADIGDVVDIGECTFKQCVNLREIKGGKNVKKIGDGACIATRNLVYADCVGANLTEVGYGAFINSGFVYDWDSLKDCAFDDYSVYTIPYDKNGTVNKIWKDQGLTITPCEHPLPTHLCQEDSRWVLKIIGDDQANGICYIGSCALMSIIHAYCGLTGLHLDTVEEFESIVDTICPGVLDGYNPNDSSKLASIPAKLGLRVETLGAQMSNVEKLQALYDALAAGKYALVTTGNNNLSNADGSFKEQNLKSWVTAGHQAVVYGVRPDGKLLTADSYRSDRRDSTKALRYALPFQKFINPAWDITILSLPDTSIYNREVSARMDSNMQTYNGEVE